MFHTRQSCASLGQWGGGGVDLIVWPREEWEPLMNCVADHNSEKDMQRRSQLSVEL